MSNVFNHGVVSDPSSPITPIDYNFASSHPAKIQQLSVITPLITNMSGRFDSHGQNPTFSFQFH